MDATNQLEAIASVTEPETSRLDAETPPAAATTSPISLPATLYLQSSLLFNRELSWLEFNQRVLDEALDANAPPLERLKFIGIFATNLDEFFMIRVSGLKQKLEEGDDPRSPDGMTPDAQLEQIGARLRPMLTEQMRALREEIVPALAEAGVRIVAYADLAQDEQREVDRYFMEHVFPVLTPQAVDPSHPFPYISNRSLNLGVMVEAGNASANDNDDAEPRFARIKVPPVVGRLVPVGEDKSKFVFLEDVIRANADALFPGMKVERPFVFRVTRDADIEIQEDEADDLMRLMERELRQRRFGQAVRLEIESEMPAAMVGYLAESLQLTEQDIYPVEGWMGVHDLLRLYDLERPDLKDRPLPPAPTAGIPGRLIPTSELEDSSAIFDHIRRADILVHQPYQTFATVTDFIRSAARDPDVLAIKMTLYRTGAHSPIVQALIEAAERGKQIAVIVELKARFDEENNIEWARRMDNAGIHVVYGLMGLKTHCKIALVVRREGDVLRRYLHVGTGNYNPATARIYTDFGIFTANAEAGADATELFNYLTGYSQQSEYRRLLVAPVALRAEMKTLVENEIAHAQAGRSARIIAKINSLTDTRMIHLLYRASQAGVSVDLIVRGICMLRPGVRGLSENIRVRSIVGRFLEHSRIFYFADGVEERVFIGSADWMQRNLDRRVELVTPVDDARLKRHLLDTVLAAYMRDNTHARRLLSDGTYERVQPHEGEASFNSQEYLAGLYRDHTATE
jgi:polyphosphate kinase